MGYEESRLALSMEGNKVHSKTESEEIGALDSGVSDLSLGLPTAYRISNSFPDDGGIEFSREQYNSLATDGFRNQRMMDSRECDSGLPRYSEEKNDEKRKSIAGNQNVGEIENHREEFTSLATDGFRNQRMTDSKECDSGLSRDSKEENDDNRNSKAGYQNIGELENHREEFTSLATDGIGKQRMAASRECDTGLNRDSREENEEKRESIAGLQKPGKYFFYDSPFSEDTGVWIPVSVPPMLENDHEEWTRGFHSNGGYFPEGDMGWSQIIEEEKELTMWDVMVEMLLAARGKVSAFASGDIRRCNFSWLSTHLLEQAWKEMAQTLTEANFDNVREILEADPPKWLADSAASACMLCGVRFHPIMCSRHHCRFCGGIFCGECSKGRSLLPAKFLVADPQRVCDVCCVRLESVQPYLMDQVSNAARLPTHDLTDLSTLRSWVNFPWGQSLEYEIYKATNTIRGYHKVGSLKQEKSIPDAILQHAKGLAIITVAKVGVMVTYNIGTGLVIARRDDGSWSPPSAISSFGVGWGAQAGGEMTDFIIVLRTTDAVKTFSGNVHLSIGAGLSAAVGNVGRAAEADVRAGDGGYAACYTYSCSKGAFVGVSLEGSLITTRTRENSRFYGSQSITASDILLGSMPKPPAAAILYRALAELYQKFTG